MGVTDQPSRVLAEASADTAPLPFKDQLRLKIEGAKNTVDPATVALPEAALPGFKPTKETIATAPAPVLALLDLKRTKVVPKENSSRSKPMPGFAPKKGPEGFRQVGLYDPAAKVGPKRRRRRSAPAELNPLVPGQKPKKRRRRRVVRPEPL